MRGDRRRLRVIPDSLWSKAVVRRSPSTIFSVMRRALPMLRTMDADSDEFTAFVAELRHASELLASGGIANERMALAVVDSLAERLLYHHAQRCFSAADARIGILTDPFPASRRDQILGDFRKRVQLALTDNEFFIFVSPLLDQLDAEIFRLAHDYRGPSYHRGDHNKALAGPLGRLYAQAVGRAFVRTMSKSFMNLAADSVSELRELQSDGNERLSPHHVSIRIIDAITGPLNVDEADLAERLRADGYRRLDAVEDLIGGLRRDLDDERIAQLIEGAQHWSQHRGDEELHRLAREEQILENETEALGEEEADDELKQRMVANMLAKFARMDELRSKTELRVKLATVGSLRKRISRLNGKAGIATLLDAYRQLDELLEVLETMVEWAFDSWDRSVQQAIDEVRGK